MTETELKAMAPLANIGPRHRRSVARRLSGDDRNLPGKEAEVWAFRDAAVEGSKGTVPGPTLRAKQGNQVIIHVKNELTEPTTVHLHGLRLPSTAGGSTSSQRKIEAGESYDYTFTVRDAGSFWYHPHVRGDTQIERGPVRPVQSLKEERHLTWPQTGTWCSTT